MDPHRLIDRQIHPELKPSHFSRPERSVDGVYMCNQNVAMGRYFFSLSLTFVSHHFDWNEKDLHREIYSPLGTAELQTKQTNIKSPWENDFLPPLLSQTLAEAILIALNEVIINQRILPGTREYICMYRERKMDECLDLDVLLLGGFLLGGLVAAANGDGEGAVGVVLLLDGGRASSVVATLGGHLELAGRPGPTSGTGRGHHAGVVGTGRGHAGVAGLAGAGGEHEAGTAELRPGGVQGHRAHGDGVGVHAGGVRDGGVVRDGLAVGAEGATGAAPDADRDALALEAHHLDPLATDAVALVLAGLTAHGLFVELLLLLGPLVLRLGLDLLEQLLLLESARLRSIVLATAALLEDLDDLEVVLGPGVHGLLLDLLDALPEAGGAGSRLGVLPQLALDLLGLGLGLALGGALPGRGLFRDEI